MATTDLIHAEPPRADERPSLVTRIEAELRRHPLTGAVVITVVLFAFFAVFLDAGFDTDDDPAMMLLANGTAYGDPRPDLIHQNVGVGLVLSGLYTVAAAIPWYALMLYAAHLVGLATLLYLVFSHPRLRAPIHLPVLAGTVVLFNLYAWMNLQFTTASMALGIGGVLLFIAGWAREETRTGQVLGAALMLGMVSLIRPLGFEWFAYLTGPLFLAVAVRLWRDVRAGKGAISQRELWRRALIFGSVVVAIWLGGKAFEAVYYAGDSEWSAFSEFDEARGRLHSTPRLAAARDDQALLAELGWSRNDMDMFDRWFYLDEDVYTTENLRTIGEATDFATGSASRWVDPLLERKWPQFRLVLLGGMLLVAMAAASWWERLFLGVVTVMIGVGSVYAVLYLRFPERIALSMMMLAAAAYLVLPGLFDAPRPRRRWGELALRGAAAVLVVIALLGFGNGLRWVFPLSSDNAAGHRELNALVDRLDDLDPSGVFVTWTGVLDMERIDPLSRGVGTDIDMIPLGWQERAPFHQDHIADLGIDDLYVALATDPSVYLTTVARQPNDRFFATYVNDHYELAGLLRPVTKLGSGGRVAVFDMLVDYSVDDARGVLTERLGDGTTRELPLSEVIDGRLENVTATRVVGWSADPTTGRTADLIVVMEGRRLRVVALPNVTRGQLADNLGVDRDSRIGFDITERRVRLDPAEVRVFAVYGDKAVEVLREGR